MHVNIQEDALPATVPTPLFSAVAIADARNDAGDAFEIFLGLNENMIAQLKERSLDKSDIDLDQNTSDRKRFGEGSYEAWYSKGRVPFTLIHHGDNKLAAIVWFGPKPLGKKSMKHLSEKESVPDADAGDWHTVSFRSYPPFRGKGVMKDFARTTLEIYMRYFPQAKLWTGADRKNTGSMALSAKLGFTIDESVSDADWVAMVRK